MAAPAPIATANCPGRDLPLTEVVDRNGQAVVPVLELGDGVELEFYLHSTAVRRGSRRVPGPGIPPTWTIDDTPSIERVRQCSDGTLLLIYSYEAELVRTTRAELLARLENGAAMKLYRKGRFAEAAEGFRRAVSIAPEFEVAATNLASALTQLRRGSEAVAVLKPLLDRATLRTYAKLCQDPDLRPLLEEPGVAAYRAPRPGNARSSKEKPDTIRGVYYSEAYKVVATVRDIEGQHDCRDQLLAVRGVRGERMLEMFAWNLCDSRRKRVANAVAADRFLADLGFDVYERGEWGVEVGGGDWETWFRYRSGGFAVTFRGGVMRVIRKDTVLLEAPYTSEGDDVDDAFWMPSAGVIAYSWHTRRNDWGPAGFDVAPLPASVVALPPVP